MSYSYIFVGQNTVGSWTTTGQNLPWQLIFRGWTFVVKTCEDEMNPSWSSWHLETTLLIFFQTAQWTTNHEQPNIIYNYIHIWLSMSFHFQVVKVCSPACCWNARALAVCRLRSSQQLRPDASVLIAKHCRSSRKTRCKTRRKTRCKTYFKILLGLAPPMPRLDFSPCLLKVLHTILARIGSQ